MRARWKFWLFDLGLVVLALAAYGNSFSAGLIFDNSVIILDDARVRAVNFPQMRGIFYGSYWPQVTTDLYRPLTTLSYWFNFTVLGNGGNPFGYHVVNFLLHAGNLLLLRRIAVRIAGVSPVAWIAAALFAVHPVTVEAVTNVVGRADLLATLAVLATAIAWLRSQETASAARSLQWRILGGVTAFLGIFAKETGVMAVAAVGLLAVHAGGWRAGTGLFIRRAALMLVPALAAAIVIRVVVVGHALPVRAAFTSNPLIDANAWTGFMTAIGVIGRSVLLLVWPAALSCDYSYPEIVPFGYSGARDLPMWLSLAGIGAGAAVIVWRRKAWPVVAFGLGWAAVMNLPTSNLLVRIGAAMAERFLYLPLTGVALAAAWVLWRIATELGRRGFPAWVLPGLCLAALGVRTWMRNADWRDSRSLWVSAVQECPRSFLAYKGLAEAIDVGPKPSESEIDRAMVIADQGMQLLENPPLPIERQTELLWVDQARRYGFKADYHAGRGEKELAEQWYRKVLDVMARAEARDAWSNTEIRAIFQRRGNERAARRHYGDLRIYTLKALAWRRLGNPAAAVAALRQARLVNPLDLATLGTLGDIDNELGNYAAVAARMLQIVALDDQNAIAWDNLVAMYQKRGITPSPVTREGPGGHLDLRHPQLRIEMNTAMLDLVNSLRLAGQLDEADFARERAIHALGCPPAMFGP